MLFGLNEIVYEIYIERCFGWDTGLVKVGFINIVVLFILEFLCSRLGN